MEERTQFRQKKDLSPFSTDPFKYIFVYMDVILFSALELILKATSRSECNISNRSIARLFCDSTLKLKYVYLYYFIYFAYAGFDNRQVTGYKSTPIKIILCRHTEEWIAIVINYYS